MPTFMNDPTMPTPSFPGSHMVVDDLSNGHAVKSDVKEETRLVMRALSRMLEMEGGSLADILRVDIHLTDLHAIQDMDTVYAEYFEPGRYPARTCTESPNLYGGSSIEITVMAKRPHQSTQ